MPWSPRSWAVRERRFGRNFLLILSVGITDSSVVATESNSGERGHRPYGGKPRSSVHRTGVGNRVRTVTSSTSASAIPRVRTSTGTTLTIRMTTLAPSSFGTSFLYGLKGPSDGRPFWFSFLCRFDPSSQHSSDLVHHLLKKTVLLKVEDLQIFRQSKEDPQHV